MKLTQKERNLWNRFLESGKAEDYLEYFEEKQKNESEDGFSS